MKKGFLLIALTVVLLAHAFAQKSNFTTQAYNQFGKESSVKNANSSTKKGGIFVSQWYAMPDLVKNKLNHSNLSTHVQFLVWDSLVKTVDANGSITYGAWQSAGQVFDPHDTAFSAAALSEFNSYQIDSISFSYAYIRNVDSIDIGLGSKKAVTDTLFIAYFKGDEISKHRLVQTDSRLALVDWDTSTRLPANYFKLDTILLHTNLNGTIDTSSVFNVSDSLGAGFENAWNVKTARLKAPSGFKINLSSNGPTQDNLVAYTLTFKTGVPTIIGSDTAVMIYSKNPSTKPAGMRRTNYFGIGFLQNDAATEWIDTSTYNTSLFALKSESYTYQSFGWNGYVPGIAFSKSLFLDTYFHLSITDSIGLGINNTNNAFFAQIFPNPANKTFTLMLDTKITAPLLVTLSDIAGNTVQSQLLSNFSNGLNQYTFNIAELKSGMYFMQLSNSYYSKTLKLIVNQ